MSWRTPEFVPAWLVRRYREQEPYDTGELSEGQIENLRPQGNVKRRGRAVQPADPTAQRSTTSDEH